MAQAYYVETPDGQQVPFDVPANATPEQVQTLAARALKAKLPNATYQRPVLSKEAQGSLSAPSGIRNRLETTAYDALSGMGVDPRYAARLGDKITGALDVLPGIGDAIQLGEAKEAWEGGRYLEAGGKAALGALGLIPGVGDVAAAGIKTALPAIAKGGHALSSLVVGPLFRGANREALDQARALERQGIDADEITNATKWFRGGGTDTGHRFEISDQNMTVNRAALPDSYDTNTTVPLSDVIKFPELYRGYPHFETARAGVVPPDIGLHGSWDPEGKILRLDPGLDFDELRATGVHELGHGVAQIERFSPGASPGSISPLKVLQDPIYGEQTHEALDLLELSREKAMRAIADYGSADPRAIKLINQYEMEQQNLHQIASHEGYKRVRGEVASRNMERRLDYSPEDLVNEPFWLTSPVHEEDIFDVPFHKRWALPAPSRRIR